MALRRVLHVHLKETDKDYYFGSTMAIYEKFTSKELGITYSSLINYFNQNKDSAYENYRCKIQRAYLETVETIKKEKEQGKKPIG